MAKAEASIFEEEALKSVSGERINVTPWEEGDTSFKAVDPLWDLDLHKSDAPNPEIPQEPEALASQQPVAELDIPSEPGTSKPSQAPSTLKIEPISEASSASAPKQKRASVKFTATQTQLLEDFYKQSENASIEKKKELAKKSGLTFEQVTRWFKNKRYRLRKTRKDAV
ncbi:hypothetical protein L596_028465 [Steinernema carpocapsae]|uniref:Homeobox domain-containing protein n=1 Tax=Steinernema carpocapsae TaxID=34508 RepID=A0A4U5LYL0_STECR|nr:hypothetical protein L596_028465 [Steinernema carpocapsae]